VSSRWRPTRLTGRTRRIFASAASVGGARVVSVVCSFVSVPLCLHYLGVEAFGVWATITSIVGLLAFADLGIGNGILSRIGSALGVGDNLQIRQTVASSLAVLSVVAIVTILLFAVAFPFVSWNDLVGAGNSVPAASVASAMAVFGVLFALNIPTTVVQRVQYALQMGYLNGAAQAGAGLLSLALVFAISRTNLGLAGMVGAVLLAPMAMTWLSAFWTFRPSRGLLPAAGDVNAVEVRAVLKSGSKFFVLGLAFCLCQASDNVIVAHVLGPQAVANYAVHQKYVAPIAFIAGLILTPLWPAYAEALARQDVLWVRTVFKRSLVAIAAAGAVMSLVLIGMLGPFFDIWLHGNITGDLLLVSSLCIWVSVELVGKAITMFLHGVDLVTEQLWLAVLYVPICLGLKIWFAQLLGPAGVPLGTCLAYVAVHAPAYYVLVRRWHTKNPASAVVIASPESGK
jgi:O-antigen/teichoic acid export membrane protein